MPEIRAFESYNSWKKKTSGGKAKLKEPEATGDLGAPALGKFCNFCKITLF